jgi:ribose-phosphate pyrophosphokinase
LSGNAIENINNSSIDKLIVSNSIDIGDKSKKCPKIDVFDVAPILSEAIHRLKTGDSISELFK